MDCAEAIAMGYLQFILVQVSWHAFKIKTESYKHCEVIETPPFKMSVFLALGVCIKAMHQYKVFFVLMTRLTCLITNKGWS